MTKRKDMTQKEFDAACEKWGITPDGPIGYFRVTSSRSVSIWHPDAGRTHREKLKYLIARQKAALKAESEVED